MFSKILIANRGEIALRIIRACREMGIQTAVVYSTADKDAAYLKLADQAICIGTAPPGESYLKVDRIIAAAEVADVEAIHPGYGFLSERARFAEICRACKIEFIGPTVEAMAAVGDKVQCKRLAKKAKVPTVPGSEGAVDDEKQALKVAADIGYPVIIKAAAGGGGRGMRLAHNDASLQAGFRQARAEAENAFKDATVYIEKYVEFGRHVEIQILADNHGNVVHLLGAANCSLPTPGTRSSSRNRPARCSAPRCARPMACRRRPPRSRPPATPTPGPSEFLVDPNPELLHPGGERASRWSTR